MANFSRGDSKSSRSPSEPSGHIIKSPMDTNDYSYIVLENGLRVLLISSCAHEKVLVKSQVNPKTGVALEVEEFNRKFVHIPHDGNWRDASDSDEDELWEPELKRTKSENYCAKKNENFKASVSLCVGVGSLQDPEDFKGMAHLCEHAVCDFGSKKYPAPCSLFNFIENYDGSINAFTSPKCTVYHFTLKLAPTGTWVLERAMDILADAITSTQFSADVLKTEVGTIDSEFALREVYDGVRVDRIFSTLFPKSHALHKFICGNIKTLDQRCLLKRINAWKDRYYRGNYMTLVINARLPLEDLKTLARDYFSKIPNSNKISPRDELILKNRNVFADNMPAFNRFYKIVPFLDLNFVCINWAISNTEFATDFNTKPALYLSYLFGSDSQIMEFLKSKYWADEIWTSFGSNTGLDYFCSPFTLEISLTELGVIEIFSVLQSVFSYLKMLDMEKPSEELFNEIRKEKADRFHYIPLYVESSVSLSVHLQQLADPKHILTSSTLVTDFDSKLIGAFIHELTPRNMNVMLVSKLHAAECTSEEEYYGTKYRAFEFRQEYLKSCEKVKIFPEFKKKSHQYKNPFRPKNLICPVGNLPGIQVMRDDPKIFFKCTKIALPTPSLGKIPVGECKIIFSCPMTPNTPRTTSFLEIFELMMHKTLQVKIVQCARAQVTINLFSYNSCRRWIEFVVKGPSGKIVEAIIPFIAAFADFENIVNERDFGNKFNFYQKTLANQILNPSSYGFDMLDYIINQNHELNSQLKSSIIDSNFRDFKNFITLVKERMWICGLFRGSVSTTQARAIITAIGKLNYRRPPDIPLNPSPRMMELPQGERCLRFKARSEDIHTTIVTNYYQFGPLSAYERDCVGGLCKILGPAAFHELREVERLSYSVLTTVKVSQNRGQSHHHGVGLAITLEPQSRRYSAGYVDERIDSFLTNFMAKMNDYEKFTTAPQFPRWLLDCGYYMKDVHDSFAHICAQFLVPSGPHFRKISIQVTGNCTGGKPVPAALTHKKMENARPMNPDEPDFEHGLSCDILDGFNAPVEFDIPKEVGNKNGYFINDIERFKDSMHVYKLPFR